MQIHITSLLDGTTEAETKIWTSILTFCGSILHLLDILRHSETLECIQKLVLFIVYFKLLFKLLQACFTQNYFVYSSLSSSLMYTLLSSN